MNDISAKRAIDLELGLDRYEGDEKIHADVLKNFKRNNKDKIEELNLALDEGNIKSAHRIAHSLRGAAGTIGATKLADAAFRVECFLDGKSMECAFSESEAFEMHVAVLENAYNSVFDELEQLVKEERKTGCGPGVMDREKTLALIDRLTPLLEAGDANSLEYLDEIDESFRAAADNFKLFTTQMGRYDFDQALETMNAIRQFMEN